MASELARARSRMERIPPVVPELSPHAIKVQERYERRHRILQRAESGLTHRQIAEEETLATGIPLTRVRVTQLIKLAKDDRAKASRAVCSPKC